MEALESRTLLTGFDPLVDLGAGNPKLFIPQTLTGRPGETIRVPITIDSGGDLTGRELWSADIIVLFDPAILTANSASLGDVPNANSGAGWNAPALNLASPGRVILGVSNQQGLGGTFAGSLVTIDFTIAAEVAPGTATVNLAASTTNPDRVTSLNEGELPVAPAPTNAAGDEIDGRVTITLPQLTVTGLTPTASGFTARFNGPLDAGVLNLYDSASGTLGPADVTLVGAATGAVRGSLVLGDSNQLVTFVGSGGLLSADTYTVTFRSAANGFRTTAGGLLDGNADGVAGDDYRSTFTVADLSAGTVMVSLGDVARGAGQAVDVPASAAGWPLRVEHTAGVTSLAVDVVYNPVLLSITGGTRTAGVPSDWTVAVDTGTPGVAKIRASGTTALAGTNIEIMRLTAAVPNNAPYGASQAIRLENVLVNGGAIAAIGDVAVHKTAYLGDADGSGIHSAADAFLVVQAGLGLASGFAAHAWTDPRIVGDADGSGLLSAADAFLIVQEGLGLSEPFVPDNPGIQVTAAGGGVDPQFRIDTDIPATARGWVTVPVRLDIESAATNVGGIDFDLFFDPALLTIDVPSGVSCGADTAAGWGVSATLVAAGQLRIGLVGAAGQPLAPGLREIVQLRFYVADHVAASVPDANPLAERAAYGRAAYGRMTSGLGEAGLRGDPLAERAGHGVLDIEAVDPWAGGYTWTAVDGSLAITAADGGDESPRPSVRRSGEGRDVPPTRMPATAVLPELEAALEDLVDDVAWAWRHGAR